MMKTKKADESEGHLIRPLWLLMVPVFFGWLGSLFFCVLLASQSAVFQTDLLTEEQIVSVETDETEMEEEQFDVTETEIVENTQFFTQPRPGMPNLIQELYRQPESRARVIKFFSGICASVEIVEAILANAELNGISPALAFALSWEESRFNPRAVNTGNHDGSIDRGLFQLNNRSFPRMEVRAFFDPEVNAKHGMSHLRYCLDTGGTEIAALAMYNAGTGRVRDSGTPKTTLDYVSRILENRQVIESEFLEREIQFQLQAGDFTEDFVEIAEARPERHRLVPLMPLASSRFSQD
jgi:hypothetical protein